MKSEDDFRNLCEYKRQDMPFLGEEVTQIMREGRIGERKRERGLKRVSYRERKMEEEQRKD